MTTLQSRAAEACLALEEDLSTNTEGQAGRTHGHPREDSCFLKGALQAPVSAGPGISSAVSAGHQLAWLAGAFHRGQRTTGKQGPAPLSRCEHG